MRQTANVIGATGLVGKQLVQKLLNEDRFEKIRIFVRRDSGIKHPKLEQQIIDFNDTKSWSELVQGEVLFSTLGTTLKQAGSQKNQYAIDFTLNYNFAEVAKRNGIESYVLVSSLSANARARLFYPRMKGELDEAVEKLGFNKLTILRPGPLAGNRQEKRLGEIIAFPIITFLTKFMLTKYQPIQDSTVAQAMLNACNKTNNDKTIWEGKEVFQLAKEK